jgi:hypothetical protein
LGRDVAMKNTLIHRIFPGVVQTMSAWDRGETGAVECMNRIWVLVIDYNLAFEKREYSSR